MTFWEHLDALRAVLFRLLIAVILIGVIAFFFKDTLFRVILAPDSPDFITYRIFNRLSASAGISVPLNPAHIDLINTGLTRQFAIHIQIALYAGLLISSPYILYLLFRFISPALYDSEKRIALGVCAGGYLMFILGILLSYFIIFPLTFQFLAYYQVSASVQNLISLDSYIETLILLSIMMGFMFELPVVCHIAARIGLLTHTTMRRYRRHALVIVLIIAAIITPTGDALTLSVVALPVYFLYELSIHIVRRSAKEPSEADSSVAHLPS